MASFQRIAAGLSVWCCMALQCTQPPENIFKWPGEIDAIKACVTDSRPAHQSKAGCTLRTDWCASRWA
ncbi:hypothetical protein OPU71_14645 [Niveibacterium sp. 24ML]|uniref:hypothetical protein n=1 Tax=Niveibacterium sp. 24ML TaxID=2985512 RepID=UPI00226E75EB|nr:hypothetical protein [Niveibacterium sp. 24ML]MCX9157365.1 hypothetical protein [Niveibacterium sp. 24ML]